MRSPSRVPGRDSNSLAMMSAARPRRSLRPFSNPKSTSGVRSSRRRISSRNRHARCRQLEKGTGMKLPRRQFLHLAAGRAALPAVPSFALAQAYPAGPVRIVVPFPAGGTSDILARLLGQWISERLGQPFVIENRPGAASNVGTEVVVRAPADGHTLLLVTASNMTNSTLYEKLNFNFIRDIAPVASINRVSLVMAVTPSFPAKTVSEFIAY